MKKIITFLICIPFLINAQIGISIDTLYSGINTDVVIYNHSIDLTVSGALSYPYSETVAIKDVVIINADTATATIFCRALSYNQSILNTYVYKYDVVNDNYNQIAPFTILDTLDHSFALNPLFTQLSDTITLSAKWESDFFDLASYDNVFSGSGFLSEILKLNSIEGVQFENFTYMDINTTDSLFKENVELNATVQIGFQTFYFCRFEVSPFLAITIDTISIVDSAIFVNSPLSGSNTISGTITSGSGKTNGSLINNLVVYLIDNNDEFIYVTETNSSGYFNFENVENNNFKLIAGDKYNEKFSVESGDNLSLSFKDGKLETFVSSIININNQNITIFPNPTSSYLEYQQINQKKINSINILNLKGEVVKLIDNPKNKIDISDLNKGIYFIKFNNKEKSNIYKFVIK